MFYLKLYNPDDYYMQFYIQFFNFFAIYHDGFAAHER